MKLKKKKCHHFKFMKSEPSIYTDTQIEKNQP